MDIQIDLETGNTTVDAAILSIGAVLFDPFSDELGETYLCAIPPSDNDKYGRTWSGSTIEFWSRNPEALAALAEQDLRSLPQAMNGLLAMINKYKPAHVWAFSPVFDLTKLRHYFDSQGSYFPIPYHRERCTRTIASVLPPSLQPTRLGTHHNALDDAIHQSRIVQAFFKNCYLREDTAA